MAVAVFDYALWAARYPTLATKVDVSLAGLYFSEATLILNNSDCSLVADVGQRLALLNMLVAHIATLNLSEADGGTGMIGRISKATEGSVSVEATLGTLSAQATYFGQTPYGLQYWRATAQYRTFQYRPGPRPLQDPFALRVARWPR